MKTTTDFLIMMLFLVFFIASFFAQKTIVFFSQDYYYTHITYTRNIHDLAYSLGKPYILWRLEQNHPDDPIYDGMLIKLKASLPNSR